MLFLWCWFTLVGLSLTWAIRMIVRHPNRDMPIMNWVWPLVALYFGPFGAALYRWLTPPPSKRCRSRPDPLPATPTGNPHHAHLGAAPAVHEHAAELVPPLTGIAHRQLRPIHSAPHETDAETTGGLHLMPGMRDPLWARSARSATHCMAGCALGDLTAMALVDGAHWMPLGGMLRSEIVLGAIFAFLFGLLVFQAFPVMTERGIGFPHALGVAFQADVLTITTYLVGQVPALYVLHRWAAAATGGHPAWTVMFVVMQGSMAVGFLTTYPLNYGLVARGLKHGM